MLTTPVSEAGIVGLSVGMALRGLRPVVEIMFGDFLLLAADQLVNHAAKFRWMTGDQVRVPLVVRTPMGGGRGYGPTHSQSLEKHFLGVPGLRTVAATALGEPGALLRTAVLADDDPVLFVEHKLLYRAAADAGDGAELEIRALGDGYPAYRVRIAGAPPPVVTLASYGYPAEQARQALQALPFEHEVFGELLVYTQLSPVRCHHPCWMRLKQTHRLLTVEEGTRTLGWGAEVVASALEAHGPGLRAGRVGLARSAHPGRAHAGSRRPAGPSTGSSPRRWHCCGDAFAGVRPPGWMRAGLADTLLPRRRDPMAEPIGVLVPLLNPNEPESRLAAIHAPEGTRVGPASRWSRWRRPSRRSR